MESEDITTEGMPPEAPAGTDGEGETAADQAQENEEESTDG